MNGCGQPLVRLEAVVNLIATTTTATGLSVLSEVDKRSYPKGVVVTYGKMERVKLFGPPGGKREARAHSY